MGAKTTGAIVGGIVGGIVGVITRFPVEAREQLTEFAGAGKPSSVLPDLAAACHSEK